jgi:antitoxin VapB
MNGNSQAVRIPAAFRLDCQDVEIEQTDSGALLIRPLIARRGQRLLQAVRGIDPDFIAALEDARSQPDPPQEREAL